ncbi:MAG: hypothetical protein PHU25_00300 [Deltaproteobacteria bacterium]|nr:hypothetical protein [Deltaproteobacteria bacterium]
MRPVPQRFATLAVAAAALAFLLPVLAGEPGMIAVLPVRNDAGLDKTEVDYLSDLIRGTAALTLGTGEALATKPDVGKALGAKAGNCDEQCALKAGKRLGAARVVLCEIRRIDQELKVTVKLLETEGGALKAMELVGGKDVASLEAPLGNAVRRVLGAPAVPGAAPPPPTGPVTLTPDEDKDHFGDLSVTLTGVKEGSGRKVDGPADADVLVNGRRVGFAPYNDGLPAGRYHVKVVRGKDTLAQSVVDIVAGKRHVVEAATKVPMTAEERASWNEEQTKKRDKRVRMERAAWEAKRAEWETAAGKAREERFPYLVSATVLGGAGIAMVIGGGVAESMALDQNDKVSSNYHMWQEQTDPEAIAAAEKNVKSAREARDLDNTLGTSFLVIGGAAIATSVVLFIIMPGIPDEPSAPAALGSWIGASINLSPLVGDGAKGAALEVRF